MKIESIRLINGLNIHSHYPVVVMRLNLEEYAEVTTKDIGTDFINRLMETLPGLVEHTCSKGYRGGFVERLYEGTLLGHVIEHVALELQQLAGIETYYGKTRKVAHPGVYNIVFEFVAGEAARYVAGAAVHIIMNLLNNNYTDIEFHIAETKRIVKATELGPSTKAIVDAALKRNIPVTRLANNSLVQLGYGAKAELIQATLTGRTPCIAVDIACDKALTKRMLADAGLPVPNGKVCNTVEEALEFAFGLQDRVVIKPVDSNQGKGVSLCLYNDNSVREAFNLAKLYSEVILVEEYIRGDHFRCLVVNGKLIAVAKRIPAYVDGDGIHTISQLISIENTNPLRGDGHEKPLTKLQIDPIAVNVLNQQNMNPATIPSSGQRVFLRENANLSTGGVAYDVTDLIHTDNCQLVEQAVNIIGLDIAGVDIVIPDISNSYRDIGGAIIEINAAPGLRMHLYPAKGQPRDVGQAVVDYLFPENENGRIPLITVTGTNGKTTTVRLIAAMMRQKYATVGYTSTDGTYVNDTCVLEGDNTGPLSTRNLLERKDIDIAVLELARGGILRGGLAFDYSDVAVVTNIGYDHVGQDGIRSQWELADIKALTLEAIKPNGYAIINAGDLFCDSLTEAARGEIIYFSKDCNNKKIQDHIDMGKRAVMVEDGYITLHENHETYTLSKIDEIPITFNGTARHNIDNVLSAVCTAWIMELDFAKIDDVLKSFNPNMSNNPGRQNFISLPGDITIMIDYAHNQSGLLAIIDFVQKLKYKKITGIICAPGDRTDEQLQLMGEIIAKGFHKVIIKEDKDKRGRQPGATSQLIMEGFVRQSPHGDVRVILEESDAVEYAINTAERDELIVITYEKLSDCINSIRKAANRIFKEISNKLIAGSS